MDIFLQHLHALQDIKYFYWTKLQEKEGKMKTFILKSFLRNLYVCFVLKTNFLLVGCLLR